MCACVCEIIVNKNLQASLEATAASFKVDETVGPHGRTARDVGNMKAALMISLNPTKKKSPAPAAKVRYI